MAEKTTSLRQALWHSADQLRGQMDANDYKKLSSWTHLLQALI